MSKTKKMTREEIREMTREFVQGAVRSKMLNEVTQEKPHLLAEDHHSSAPNPDDAMHAANAIGGTLFDALEELGADAQSAREIHHLLKTTAWLDDALDKTLDSYLKKLNMMGGMPKPRSV